MSRRLLGALLAGWLLAWLLAIPAQAAQVAGVRLEASAGFDKYSRPGTWLPVRITLTNTGADLRGVVRVRHRAATGGQVVTSQAVELPAGARKQITLLVLSDGGLGLLPVQLLVGGQVLAETAVEITHTNTDRGLLGVVASSPETAARVMASLGAVSGAKASLTLADLPEQAAALDGLDTLIVNGVSTRALTPAQVAALGEWVAGGGALILGGGGGAPAVLEGLGGLAPVRLTGPATGVSRLPALETLTRTPVEARGPFVVASAAPLPEAAVLLAQDGAPLLITRPLGRGWVTFVALDLGLDPFLGWTGANRFWNALPRPVPLRGFDDSPSMAGERLRWTLGSGTALDLPSAGLLALLLLGYIVVIGPLNYLVLRRFDRREWAWVTTPTITLLFSGALFLVGTGARGGQVAINTIAISDSVEGMPGAAVASFIGVFSPGRATQTLRLPEGALLSGLASAGRGAGAMALDLWQGGGTEARDLPFAAGEFKVFVAQGRAEAAPIAADLRLEGNRLLGTVRNASDQPLTSAAVVIGHQAVPLGTLAPGASTVVDWSAPNAPAIPLNTRQLTTMLAAGGGGPDLTNEWAIQARTQLVEILYGDQAGRQLSSGVEVVAWQATAPLPLTSSGLVDRQQAVTLVRHRVAPAIRPAAGWVVVPPGLLAHHLASEDRASGPWPASLLPPGETIVTYPLPASLAGLEAEEVALLITTNPQGGVGLLPPARPPGTPATAVTPTPGPAGQPVVPRPPPRQPGAVQFALYDHQQQTWVDLPHAGEGVVVVPAARSYISREGPPRLRVTVGAGQPVFFQSLDLGLRGRVP